MENLVTADKIIDWVTEQVEKKLPIDTHTWVEVAQKLNVLLQNEQEVLFTMEQEVAQRRKLLFEDPEMTAVKAKIFIEATDEFRKARIQKSKIDRGLETIRLAKLQARTAAELMKNQM